LQSPIEAKVVAKLTIETVASIPTVTQPEVSGITARRGQTLDGLPKTKATWGLSLNHSYIRLSRS
jgi:hypothetical protein